MAETATSRASRTVQAGQGWAWITSGWEMFRKQPGAWIGLVVVALVLNIVLALVPGVGSLASFIVGPVLAGGVMLVAERLAAVNPDELSPRAALDLLYELRELLARRSRS